MNGGSFFPPGTLLRLPRRRQDNAGKGERRAASVTLVHVRQDCQSMQDRTGNRVGRRTLTGWRS